MFFGEGYCLGVFSDAGVSLWGLYQGCHVSSTHQSCCWGLYLCYDWWVSVASLPQSVGKSQATLFLDVSWCLKALVHLPLVFSFSWQTVASASIFSRGDSARYSSKYSSISLGASLQLSLTSRCFIFLLLSSSLCLILQYLFQIDCKVVVWFVSFAATM